MKDSIKQLFQDKMTTPEEAVKCVKSGDTVFIGTFTSIPYALNRALAARGPELRDIKMACSQILKPTDLTSGKYPNAFGVRSYYIGAQERALRKAGGYVDYTCCHLSDLDIFFRETAPADVAFFEVSEPDEDGYMSYGASGPGMFHLVKGSAKRIILQINPKVPWTCGDGITNRIHISEADAVVRAEENIVEIPNIDFSEPAIQTISKFIAGQVHDGDCVQLGIGGLANAVGAGLTEKNDLGIHTEMLSDTMVRLIQNGNVTNARKTFLPGKTVAAFAGGTKNLYDFLDHNQDMYFAPFTFVNDPVNIAKNDNMVSVNTCINADMFGQINADNFAGIQYSSTGGQVDYVRGAQMSKGGRSFLAFTSTVTTRDGKVRSRILPQLPLGTCVTTPRSDVQYVVTEYGCVNLKPLSMRERVRAMISLAHPNFRDGLRDAAKSIGLY